MTLQWITRPPEFQNVRFSIKSMLGILVRRTSIPLRYLQLELRASPVGGGGPHERSYNSILWNKD